MSKADIVSEFVLNKTQVDKVDFYLSSIIKHNKHTNLVGKSTIENIWERHVLDCLQLTKHIPNKTAEGYITDFCKSGLIHRESQDNYINTSIEESQDSEEIKEEQA